MISVELLDRVFQCDSSMQGAKEIMISIDNVVSELGMIIDCMDIDDNKIYSDYEKYIEENIDDIKSIHVNLITKDENIINILNTTYSYIQRVLPELQQIINSFYTGEKTPAIIDNLESLTEGITWIFFVGREIIDNYNQNKYIAVMLNMGYGEDINRLGEVFTDFRDAIMNMDYILIADILSYEVSDVFNKIAGAIEKLKLKESVSDSIS